MRWHRREPCDHPEPREVTVEAVITDADGNVRAVRSATVPVICEHWYREEA
jgi:hypothetical protein